MSMDFLMKSLLADFGIAVGTLVKGELQEGVEVFSDSSSKSFRTEERTWTSKARPCLLAKEATVESVNTAVNVADALTKPVANATMNRHLKSMGFEFRQAWSGLHRRKRSSTSPQVRIKGQSESELHCKCGSKMPRKSCRMQRLRRSAYILLCVARLTPVKRSSAQRVGNPNPKNKSSVSVSHVRTLNT
eukprot:6017877-Amphidinium_carterae.3